MVPRLRRHRAVLGTTLVLAGLLVPMGSLGDRIGRRRLLLIGATGFTALSAAAAFAPSAGWLVAALTRREAALRRAG